MKKQKTCDEDNYLNTRMSNVVRFVEFRKNRFIRFDRNLNIKLHKYAQLHRLKIQNSWDRDPDSLYIYI